MRTKWFVFFFFLLVALATGIYLYHSIFSQTAIAGEGKFDFKIHDEATLDQVIDSLTQEGLNHPQLFDRLSRQMNYNDQTLKDGLYEIDRQWSIITLIRHLRSGQQKPVSITINSVRTVSDLVGKLTRNLELDSLAFLQYLRDSSLIHDTTMTRFIPNTYSVYWNIGPKALMSRMDYERKQFFSKNNRLEKAKMVGLSPSQVYTLASIVEMESTLTSEKPQIASVYLNRLKKGIKLQADPTVVFANGDFTIRRVLNIHLALDSPYNTYKYEGLPPGPICMPSISSIDAVLSPADTDYIFFCAKPGYQNGHAFASTLRQHNNNARRYREWLQSEGIR